jgi:nitrite reductase (NADH) small subunit
MTEAQQSLPNPAHDARRTTHDALDVRRVVAGTVEELPPGARKIIVPFRGRAGIGVFNIGGTYYALRNLCPHKLGPLCTGRVSGRVVADAPPSTYAPNLTIEQEGAIIRCPWHLWEFDITTGHCLVDPKKRVKTYPIAVEDGEVVVYANLADVPVVGARPPSPPMLGGTPLVDQRR